MIRPEDIEFHHPPNAGHGYAETNSFTFTLPEHRIAVQAYTVSRKGIGAMAADVTIWGDLAPDRAACLHIDSQQHLPAVERLSEYRTASGLSVRAHDPRHYHIAYAGPDGVSFDVEFAGLMEPFDIHDPDHSPMTKPQTSLASQHAGSGLGAGYGGHFDLTGRITGSLTLGGRQYRVDCVETMDHSWGPRSEIGIHSMGWMHAHFGVGLSIHWIAAFDPAQKGEQQWKLAHGYVLEDGVVHGLTQLKLRTTYAERVPVGFELQVTDKRGRSFEASGTAIIGGPWTCYVSTETQAVIARWVLSDGRVGHGMCMVNESMQSLNRRLGKRAANLTVA